MHLHKDSICTAGKSRFCHWRYQIARPGAVRRVHQHRQVAALLDDGDRTQVESVASGGLEGRDPPLTENDVGIPLRQDILGGQQQIVDSRRHPALENYRLAASTECLEQSEVLHVASADLKSSRVILDIGDVGQIHNLKLITEVMDANQIELIGKYSDIYQVGARNMQNFTLLRELGHTRKPVMIKRGLSATIEEWLMSAEYILAGGNNDVILCERGIRTFETATRNTFDISAIPVVKKLSHLPVVADPSHGAGRRDMVAPMARAAVAAGADGLIIEVHNDPDHALSDGAQSMFPVQFDRLMAELRIIAPAIGRSICLEPMSRRGWSR